MAAFAVFGLICCGIGFGALVRERAPAPLAKGQPAPLVKGKEAGKEVPAIRGMEYAAFVARFGPADAEDSTEFDNPRPAWVLKSLEYRKARVKVFFTPPEGIGAKPPIKTWIVLKYIDPDTKSEITPEEAASRLASRAELPGKKVIAKSKEEKEAEEAARQKEFEEKARKKEADAKRILADLKSTSPTLRTAAIRDIGELGDRAKEATGDLVELLADKAHRDGASKALAGIGKDAMPELLKGLQSKNALVRQPCARLIGNLGPDAREAIPILKNLARMDPSISVREESQAALDTLKR